MIMMTKQEKKGNQLVQVNKANGEIMNAIDIKNDKEPEYEVDQIYNNVYYRTSASELVCYGKPFCSRPVKGKIHTNK
jgi:hypothetical protein